MNFQDQPMSQRTASGSGRFGRRHTDDRLSQDRLHDHLSDVQIDDYLIGDLAEPATAHLAGCEFCDSRVTDAAAPIEAFKAVTVAWSERRSATLPLHQTLARSAKFHPRLAWAGAVAAVLAIGLAIPVVTHQQRQETARMQAAGTANDAEVSRSGDNSMGGNIVQDNIVQDNQMLKAIDRELDASVESPEVLGLRPVAGAAERKPSHPSSVQD
jgi:hypothetical protein